MFETDLHTRLKIDMRRYFSYLVVFVSLIVVSLSVLAAKESVKGMSQDVYEKLNQAQQLIEEKSFNKAKIILTNLAEKKHSSYESAHIWNIIAIIEYQLENNSNALDAMVKALSYPDLPLGFHSALLTRTVQLHMIEEDYVKALEYIKKLLVISESPSGNDYLLATQASYYLKNYKDAKMYIEKALDQARKTETTIKENWLLMANAVYHALDDQKSVFNTQILLLELYPKPKYLMNLAAHFSANEQFKKQLFLFEALYDGDYLTESSHLTSLASLYSLYETPYKAAKIIEQGIEDGVIEKNQRNLERLAQAWFMAGHYEKSINPQVLAAELSETGDTYVFAANTYIHLGMWKEALELLDEAIEKSNLRDPGNTYVLQGMALYRIGNNESALQSFLSAKDYKTTEKLAVQWINFIRQDIEKQKSFESI